MHTYQKTQEGKWAVGMYIGNGSWRGVKTFKSENEAAAYCNFLNGGIGSFLSTDQELRYFGEIPL